MSLHGVRLGTVTFLLVACARAPEAAQSSQHGRLPGDAVARVANEQIARGTVARIAATEQVTLVEARERATTDALFAVAARETFRARPLVPVLARAAAARALLEGMKADALARGAPSEAEVAELTEQRWVELDRPESARTTHAVALVNKPEDDAKARAVAERIFAAVRELKDPTEFMRVAKEVPHEDIEVRVERLPAVTRDGRAFDPDKPNAGADSRFDPEFAKAATGLAAGEVSTPVRSAFGYHVILCEARLPELRVPPDQRRVLLHDEVIKARAERAKQELLARLSASTPVQISRASDELTAQVVFVEETQGQE